MFFFNPSLIQRWKDAFVMESVEETNIVSGKGIDLNICRFLFSSFQTVAVKCNVLQLRRAELKGIVSFLLALKNNNAWEVRRDISYKEGHHRPWPKRCHMSMIPTLVQKGSGKIPLPYFKYPWPGAREHSWAT